MFDRAPGADGARPRLRVAVAGASAATVAKSLVSLPADGPAGSVEVLGPVGTPAGALRLIAETAPDVVLVGSDLPAPGCVELVRYLCRADAPRRPGPAQGAPPAQSPRRRPLVVVLPCDDAQARDAQADDAQADDAQAADAQAADARADDAQAADARSAHARAADAALRAGAAAVIDVGTAPELTVAVLVAVSSGLRVLPGPVLDRLLTRARPVGDGAAPDVVEALGEQERHLLRLVASGLEIAAIAARLYVSERTAKRMVADLRDRLGVSTRIEMAAFAGRVGLLDLPGP